MDESEHNPPPPKYEARTETIPGSTYYGTHNGSGERKVNTMTAHGAATTFARNILKCHLEQDQLEVGVGNPFYELPYGIFLGWTMDWWFIII